MAAGYREQKDAGRRLFDRLVDNGLSVKKALERFFRFEEKSAGEVVEELFSMEDLDVSNLEGAVAQEVEKLREKLESGTSQRFSSDEAALLLYSYLTREMSEAREIYEKKSKSSREKQRQEAQTYMSRMSIISDISRILENRFDLNASNASRELLLMESTEEVRAMADGGQRAESAAESRLKEFSEKNSSLREYVEKEKGRAF